MSLVISIERNSKKKLFTGLDGLLRTFQYALMKSKEVIHATFVVKGRLNTQKEKQNLKYKLIRGHEVDILMKKFHIIMSIL